MFLSPPTTVSPTTNHPAARSRNIYSTSSRTLPNRPADSARYSQSSTNAMASSNSHTHSPRVPTNRRPVQTSSASRPYTYATNATPSQIRSTNNTDSQSPTPTRQAYFFDVLRSDPSTSSLEHIASSNSIRNSHSSMKEEPNHLALGVNGGSRPAFRVAMASSGVSTESGRGDATAQHLATGPNSSFSTRNPNLSVVSPSHHNRYRHAADVPSMISFPLQGSPASVDRLAPGSRRVNSHGRGNTGDGPGGGGHPHGTERGKRHECHHCKKRFNRPSSLRIHVNTHTGAKRKSLCVLWFPSTSGTDITLSFLF